LNIQPYMGDVALMTLSLPKSWTVRAGQRIHLAVPQVGTFYVFKHTPLQSTGGRLISKDAQFQFQYYSAHALASHEDYSTMSNRTRVAEV
jgi:hypothetical protein